jgi:hypothetical protein
MVSPENVSHWSLVKFTKINAKLSYTSTNSFSDENGTENNSGFTASQTETIFSAGAESTTVQIIKKMDDLAQLEKFVSMGFKEGMALTMKNLDELLATISKTSL